MKAAPPRLTCEKVTKTYLKKVLILISFISMPIEEYEKILATLLHLKNQRQTVLSMRMKRQGSPI